MTAILLSLFSAAAIGWAQSTPLPPGTHAIVDGKPYEITFHANQTESVGSPDVFDYRLSVLFEHETGDTIRIAGFWDGVVGDRSTWKVRFRPQKAGQWEWQSHFSAGDDGLDGLTGSFSATADPTGGTDFDRHGWLEVAPSGRHLQHADGKPFFWQGDMAWEISWKSTPHELEAYIQDRKRKGFNAVYLVVHSHQFLYPEFVTNRLGVPAFIGGYSGINPRYFDYLDHMVTQLNQAGIAAAIVPLWATIAEVHHEGQPHHTFFTKAQGLSLARYVGARYAGHNVVWIAGGDQPYDTDEKRDYWTSFAEELRAASGPQHLRTIHPNGYAASFSYFDFYTPWIDFHMYHSSHIPSSEAAWIYAREGYQFDPPKPNLNAEPNFEDLLSAFWDPTAPPHRISSAHVRHAVYESFLWGAFMGLSYGGNGVWQWSTPSNPGSNEPRLLIPDAFNLSAAGEMAVMRRIFEAFDWYNMVPCPERVMGTDSPDGIAMARRGDHMHYIYIPEGTNYLQLDLPSPRWSYLKQTWINPSTGDTADVSDHNNPDNQPIIISLSSERDWVLILEGYGSVNMGDDTLPMAFRLHPVYPNPFNPTANIPFSIEYTGRVTITVHDLLGREVSVITDQIFSAGEHTVSFEAEGLASGIYVIRMLTTKGQKSQKAVLIK